VKGILKSASFPATSLKKSEGENTEKMVLAVGDTVTLKSGGSLMTINSIPAQIQILGPDVTV